MARVRLPAQSLVTAYQVHGIETRVVDHVWSRAEAPKIDAMVSNTRGISLGILTADCAPVLLADAQAGIIGAAHAGWRGAFGGVLDSVVRAMVALGAEAHRIAAGIGPAIGLASYEVGPEFPEPFIKKNPANAAWFVAHGDNGRFRFNLPGYVEARLRRAGISRIERADLDTCTNETDFFSHRRMVHRKEPDYGRQLSVIGLI